MSEVRDAMGKVLDKYAQAYAVRFFVKFCKKHGLPRPCLIDGLKNLKHIYEVVSKS